MFGDLPLSEIEITLVPALAMGIAIFLVLGGVGYMLQVIWSVLNMPPDPPDPKLHAAISRGGVFDTEHHHLEDDETEH